MNRYIKHTLSILCLLLVAGSSRAQLELSTGIDINYPLLINGNNARINYGQFGFGVRAGVAYKPEETQFFPILNLSLGRTRLPLKQVEKNVAVLNFTYLNVMLNENYIVRMPKSELYIYGGVGFSYFMSKKLGVAGSGNDFIKSSIDSTLNLTNVFPAINIGFEYNYGQDAGKDLYLTMGIDFQYILLLKEQNTYYFTLNKNHTNTNYTASLSGNVISPGFYIALHYLVRHKKSGFYLK